MKSATCVALAAAAALSASPAAADVGDLTQKPSPGGCVSADGTGGNCALSSTGTLQDATGVAVSPDGLNVYVASPGDDSVAIFDRDPTTGVLTQKPGIKGCIAEIGGTPTCDDGRALDSAHTVAVSPDGRTVYVGTGVNAVDPGSSGIAVLDRVPSGPDRGELSQKATTPGCVSFDGSGGTCIAYTPMQRVHSIAVSPDASSVYVGVGINGKLITFDRENENPMTVGEITPKECDGNGGGGGCVDATALAGPVAVAVSPDGKSVYTAGRSSVGGLAIFDRDDSSTASNGSIVQKPGAAGCVQQDNTAGCSVGVGNLLSDVSVRADGRFVYVGTSPPIVAVLARTTTGISRGELTLVPDCWGPLCVDPSDRAPAATYLAESPDSLSLYASGIAVVDSDSSSGFLSQDPAAPGCVTETGLPGFGTGPCVDGVALSGAGQGETAVSPDGRNAYSAAPDSDAVAAFDRETPPVPPTGTTTVPPTGTTTVPAATPNPPARAKKKCSKKKKGKKRKKCKKRRKKR